MSKTTISKSEIRQLVVARLRSMTPGRKIAIAGEGSFSKDEMIAKIEAKDILGDKIVKIHMSYLRSLKNGVS